MSFQTIQATVLQKNAANAFICGPCGDYGKAMPIPCGTAAILGSEYWAVPVNMIYFQGWKYLSKTADKPTIDSVACFKVTNSITSDWYMVVGTIAAYAAACAACCDASPVPSLVVDDLIDMPVCQNTCTNDGTNWDAFFAAPNADALGAGKYVARVESDGELVAEQTFGAGSANIAALVIWLNANAASVGVWSNPIGETIRVRTTLKKLVCVAICVKTA